MKNHFKGVQINFNHKFWCSSGDHWVEQADAVVRNGLHWCPVHKGRLRERSRNLKFRRLETKK